MNFGDVHTTDSETCTQGFQKLYVPTKLQKEANRNLYNPTAYVSKCCPSKNLLDIDVCTPNNSSMSSEAVRSDSCIPGATGDHQTCNAGSKKINVPTQLQKNAKSTCYRPTGYVCKCCPEKNLVNIADCTPLLQSGA